MRATLVLMMFFVTTTAQAERLELESPSVVVLDATSGDVIFDKDPDAVRPIASLTKIFVALVLRNHELDLDGWTEITDEDAKIAEGGAGTRLLRGETFRNVDLLHAMLLVSDNRVPTALARSVKLSPRELLAEMNALAAKLGLEATEFEDVTGITGNRSTARELAIATRQALRDPVLARIMRTRYARISSQSQAVTIDYKNTVLPLWDKTVKIRGGKTGTTESAGHCMVIGAQIDGRAVTMAFLGGESTSSRFVDFARMVHWLAKHADRDTAQLK
jgi:D-alanyl-D-alanine endopeptidase (penicillin-binding protein 7)